MEQTDINVVDFFSGCGGTSLGLQQAGMIIKIGIDKDLDSGKTFSKNFQGSKFLYEDISLLDPQHLFPDGKPEGYLLFSGCAPCQPFTKQHTGRKPGEDERRDLLKSFARQVAYWKPDFVLVENVPGLSSDASKSAPFNFFLKELRRLQYNFDYGAISARAYGVPQKRERLVLIGSKLGPIKLPASTHGVSTGKPYTTVRDFINDLAPIRAGEKSSFDEDHQAAALSEINLTRIRVTPEGGGRQNWPDTLLNDCQKGYKGHSDVYGRLWWDRPASALTTKCISYSNGRFGHPEQDRALSIREAARLQTFPDTFKFSGSLKSRARQVGNAVPPLMAFKLGIEIQEHIAKIQY